MRSFLKLLLLCLLVGGSSNQLLAQGNVRDSAITMSMISAVYTHQFPIGVMAERFTNNSAIGASFMVKHKSQWMFGIEGRFMFADSIKETGILDSISGSNGFIIDRYGEFAEVFLYERGFSFTAKFGRLFPVGAPNKNSGFVGLFGVGFLQHQILIDNTNYSAPQLSDEYKKGYDRLTNGFAMSQYIGYHYAGNNRWLNFFIGIEFIEAFTKNRRAYNFDQMKKDNDDRVDVLFGIKAGFSIPIYKRAPQEFYYY